jgi:archaellum biogenesis ATPase FlaH
MTITIQQEVKSVAKGFRVWPVENAFDFCDKVLIQGDVILNSDHGAVLTAGGILQLTGAGKIGKSMLLLNIAYGLALGRDVLGFGISKQRRVLYLNGENSQGTMQERFTLLRNYFCIDEEQEIKIRENLQFCSVALLLPKSEALSEIRGNLAEIRPEILILDPLKNFFSGEENSSDSMRDFMAAIRKLILEFNVTVIILHHTGKKQNEDGFYSGRGSSLLADDAEVTAAFRKNASEKGRFELSVTGRNCDEFTLHLMRQPERWYLYSLTDEPQPQPDHVLIEILDSLPEQFTTGQFHESSGAKTLSLSTANRKLRVALDSGLIEKVVQGKFKKSCVVSLCHFPKGVEQVTQQENVKNSLVSVVPNDTKGVNETPEPADDGRSF